MMKNNHNFSSLLEAPDYVVTAVVTSCLSQQTLLSVLLAMHR